VPSALVDAKAKEMHAARTEGLAPTEVADG
jgi:hypothetical protein